MPHRCVGESTEKGVSVGEGKHMVVALPLIKGAKERKTIGSI